MAISKVTYTAPGGVAVFAVPFPYISQAHVQVTLNGVPATYTWLSSTQIQFSSDVTVGVTVLIKRVTPPDTPLFNTSDGSILTSADLNILSRQAVYIAQETADIANDVVGVLVGPQGPAGPAGAAGTNGTPGGATGPTGATGAAGAKGDKGDTGDTGAAGANGATWSQGTAAASGGNNGDFYLRTTTGEISYKSGGVWTIVVTLPIATNLITTGDVKLTLKTTADTGWVLCDDGSIGSASSAATNRANADTNALFLLLWTFSDSLCPVSGGRGVSATADWTANKNIGLTKLLGRAIAISGSGSGLTARTHGSTTGSEAVAVPLVAHTHTLSVFGSDDTGSNVAATGNGTAPGSKTTSSAGTSSPTLSPMQPTSFLNAMVKL